MAPTRLGDDVERTHEDVGRLGRDAQRMFERGRDAAPGIAREAADRAREMFGERVERWRAQGADAADAAGENLESARVFVVDRVQERPLTATFAALGVGFLLGVLLAGSRR